MKLVLRMLLIAVALSLSCIVEASEELNFSQEEHSDTPHRSPDAEQPSTLNDFDAGSSEKRGFSAWAGKRAMAKKFEEEAFADDEVRIERLLRGQSWKYHQQQRQKRSIEDDGLTSYLRMLLSADVSNDDVNAASADDSDVIMRSLLNDVMHKRSDAGSTGERRGFSPWAGKRSAPPRSGQDDVMSDADVRRCIAILQQIIGTDLEAMTSLDGADEPDALTSQDLMNALKLLAEWRFELQQEEDLRVPDDASLLLRNRKASFGPWKG